jgi:hypothetical protein
LTDVPESLEILNFGDRYNKKLPEISHTKLKKLYFGNDYDELLISKKSDTTTRQDRNSGQMRLTLNNEMTNASL